MLVTMTHETFAPLTGHEFLLVHGAGTLPLTLSAVEAMGSAEGRPRQAFSLLFSSASHSALPQAIYRLECAALPPLEIFLVPVGADANGVRYEAIFT